MRVCGIVGYVGHHDALPYVLDGLARLEYRGYDSAGIAVATHDRLQLARTVGGLQRLRAHIGDGEAFTGTTVIGHTRWATHGGPTVRNAHPHVDASGRLALVHNGIIENAAALRGEVERAGVELVSETDTEVVVHLLALALADGGDLARAMASVCPRLEGTFALLAVHADRPDELVAAHRASSLLLGVGDREMFVASDVAAFLPHTRSVVEPAEDQVVVISAEGAVERDLAGQIRRGRSFVVDWDAAAAQRNGHATFMGKEITEQPQALADTLRGHLEQGRVVLDGQRSNRVDLRRVDRVVIVACGSAYHSGLVATYAIEQWARIPVEVQLASEFRYRDPVLDRDTLVVAVSQSGETMDTLEALRHARRQHCQIVAVCNTVGAQIPREADGVLYTRAGPEIGVAATKSFLTQVLGNHLLGLALAQARGSLPPRDIAAVVEELATVPDAVRNVLAGTEGIRLLGRSLAGSRAVLFIGRQVGYPVALEGALKLKELAYMHAEGFAAGELKHGPIALIEEGLPVVAIMPSASSQPVLYRKMVSNIREIGARGARTIVIGERSDPEAHDLADHFLPIPHVSPLLQPLVATVPLQILAAEIAGARGYDIDKPRNLAKSVTVE